MTCSDPAEGELESAGWERCFVAEEPRLSEAVETYQELGYETLTRPVTPRGGDECTQCLMAEPNRYRVIYIRRQSTIRDKSGDQEE